MKTILVVEDDQAIREIVKLILESAGYEVQTAINGADGVEVLRTGKHPDLIFLDLNMPVMDGWEFLERFRRDNPEPGGTPVVVLTASGDRPKPLGATALFQKPVELDVLLKVADEYCTRTA